MTNYLVDIRCPRCGKIHRVSSSFRLDDGPTEPGSLTDLYAEGNLPARVVTILAGQVWCKMSQRWVKQQDRRRVYLTPCRR